ncbi:MAG: hypothetical protein ACRDH5_02980, partial [bacterium]
PMSLTNQQLKLIEEGIRLAVAAVLAAVRALGEARSNEPLDWSKLRITETPAMALEKARKTPPRQGETEQ